MHAGICTPLGCGPGEPPHVWAWRPPLPDPSISSLAVGLEMSLETCKACWDTTCKACWDSTHPPTPPYWTEWQIRVKTLLLRAVISSVYISFIQAFLEGSRLQTIGNIPLPWMTHRDPYFFLLDQLHQSPHIYFLRKGKDFSYVCLSDSPTWGPMPSFYMDPYHMDLFKLVHFRCPTAIPYLLTSGGLGFDWTAFWVLVYHADTAIPLTDFLLCLYTAQVEAWGMW